MADIKFNGKRILVTGAAGFIGSNIVDRLLSLKAEVVGYDNLVTGKMENLHDAQKSPHFSFIKGDICNQDLLVQSMKNIHIVFHEAAFTSVTQSLEKPQLCNKVNVEGTLIVLDAARICNVEKVVFASSAAVYGDSPELPKHEKMACFPISPYGVSKLAAERYMMAYCENYGLNTTALRYFNVFGPKQLDSPYSGAIAIFVSKIFNNQDTCIFGDGTQTRDFIYVKDVVKANILSVTSKNAKGQIINVATGKSISIREILTAMIEYSKKTTLKIIYKDARKGEILRSVANIDLAKKILRFNPDHDALSGFKEYFALMSAQNTIS